MAGRMILVYKKWMDFPEGKTRSFKTIGNPVKKATNYRKIANWLRTEKGQLLVIVKDIDYENAIVADGNRCLEFIKNCYSDLGYMFKERGKKK
jgi:hypothetical protein